MDKIETTKKMSSRYMLAIALSALIITTLAVSASVSAHDGEAPQRGPQFDQGQHEELMQAVENGDYDAWKAIVGDNKMFEAITSENFGRLSEAHALVQSGDKEGAQAIFEELGINPPKPMMNKRGDKNGKMGPWGNDEARAAIEAGDYDAFIAAIGDKPFAKDITAENFDRMIEAHDLRQSGDEEGAEAMMDELGIEHSDCGDGHGFMHFPRQER